jgi:hypothetical protein
MAASLLPGRTKKESLMHTSFGHLTYCTNIHPGESWQDHFDALQQHVPVVKKTISPDQPFGIGLRLSNKASVQLAKEDALQNFRQWLQEQSCYVFTINGFPYGSFHQTIVKDKVHEPDWTTMQRVDYTIRLAQILAAVLPDKIEGGISTSPLTYRHWQKSRGDREAAFARATCHMLQVVKALIKLKVSTGKTIHFDIEPEPDGLLESGTEFLEWYNKYLLPMGTTYLQEQLQFDKSDAEKAIKEHVQLCYDVCHFAVGYERHVEVLQQLQLQQIKVGKIQISAALKGIFSGSESDRQKIIDGFRQFNEPTYLHQVVAKMNDGNLKRYADLPQALQHADDTCVNEWRAHYHVPIFIDKYDALQSTQKDIQKVLQLHCEQPFTTHLEVETYTWDVLPQSLKLPLTQSIIRELHWVLHEMNVLKEVDA